MASDNKIIWLVPIALLLLAFRKPKTTTTSCVIVPDEAGAEPLYGGTAILKLKPNTKIYASHSTDTKVIAKKSCYVEKISTSGAWTKIVNRPMMGEGEYTGWILTNTIEKVL